MYHEILSVFSSYCLRHVAVYHLFLTDYFLYFYYAISMSLYLLDLESDANSFHPSMWEEDRARRQRIHFDFESELEEEGNLQRTPTPYPKEMKHRLQHMRNLALKQLNVPNGQVKVTTGTSTEAGTSQVKTP